MPLRLLVLIPYWLVATPIYVFGRLVTEIWRDPSSALLLCAVPVPFGIAAPATVLAYFVGVYLPVHLPHVQISWGS